MDKGLRTPQGKLNNQVRKEVKNEHNSLKKTYKLAYKENFETGRHYRNSNYNSNKI